MVRVLNISEAHVHLHYSARRFRQLLVDELRDKAALNGKLVNPGSKAAQRGVREGDVITSINGQPTKCLTNGDSHGLLRTVGDSLRLGLNQDTNGSPKRRNKEPLKREASSGSTQSTPSTPGAVDTAPVSTAATPSDETEPSNASTGAKVFVCGIWNSVHKTKRNGKNDKGKSEKQEKQEESDKLEDTTNATTISSSKARRLRRMKLKCAKREEHAVDDLESPIVEESPKETNKNTEGNFKNDESIEVVVVMDEEEVRRAGGELLNDEITFSENMLNEGGKPVLEISENRTTNTSKTKTKKKNNKNKGFSLSNIFSSKNDKKHSNEKVTEAQEKGEEREVNNTDHKTANREATKFEDLSHEKSVKIIPAVISEVPEKIVQELNSQGEHQKTDDNHSQQQPKNENNNKEEPMSMSPSIKFKESPVINSSTIFTIIETETVASSTTKTESPKSIKSGKISSTKLLDNANFDGTTKPCGSPPNTNLKQTTDTKKLNVSDKVKPTEKDQTRPISIFVVPPDNVAEETESTCVDWESVSDFDTSSHVTSSDDDVRPETLIHLPSNDLQTAAVDGKNGIVQVSDYELSVQDLSCPLMDPEEEARLRRFLETLNLTRPEEYDDTSSTKSYGDSSSTLSGTSPIPPHLASDEVVVYRHLKSHSIAEPCFIPPRHHHHLDVITEETSDPSDSEKINASKRPWENPDLIKKNNEIDNIPNDWYGSDEEPETTSDEGGIDTSWRDGRKLEDVDGVEVVYLSDDSDDEETFNKTFEENLTRLQNYSTLPQLVVVHNVDRKEEKNLVKLPQLVRKINNINTEKQTVSQEKIKTFSIDQPKKVTVVEINSNPQINNNADGDGLVKLRPKENKTIQALEENKLKTHPMDEIVAIIDTTYEINKDIFAKPSSIEPHFKRMKTSNSTDNTDDEVTTNIHQYHQSELKDAIITDPTRNYSKPGIVSDLELEHLNRENHSHQTNPAENPKLISLDKVSPVQDVTVATTPPVLSRQESSSSATSQSTAKYNPGHSPMSSEAEDRAEQEYSPRKKQKKMLYNPKRLSRLSTDVIALLPHGEFYLKKIGVIDDGETEIPNNDRNTCEMSNGKLTSLPPSGISTRRSSLHELENIFSPCTSSNNVVNVSSRPMPVLMKSPPPSALASPAPNGNPWVGLPTSTDERVLVCLSPSQSRDSTMNTPKEATELLDLHKKFVERRGYHETSKRNSIYSPRSERSCTPDLGSPDLIRLEPYESKKEQVYTPELLIEAANLLALKEYRRSRFRSSTQSKSVKTPETTFSVKTNGSVSKKNEGLSGVTSPEPEIAADSEGPDSNRSAGTSRLLALLQGSGVPHSPPTITTAAATEMNRVDNSVSEDHVHRCSGSYLSEWLTMTENVTSIRDLSNIDLNRNVIGLRNSAEDQVTGLNNLNHEESVERRQFEAEKYKISKQGDIAIIQSKDDGNGKPPIARKERPKSLPPIGVPALTPSGGELFREQMYHEYMDKVAERTERRQQKVIKISSRPSSMYVKPEPEPEKNPQNPPPVNQLESEFMVKVRERMSKLGINLDDEEEVTEDIKPEEPPAEELPKHLQEFIELTTAPLAGPAQDAPTDGVWSPGATPEPQRKEFNFSAVKEEVTQEDTDPVPPIWTPSSAQASPTPERKAFRPVNFESPKLSRKTYNQKPSEVVPKPPTDLPLPLDSPSHSQTSSLSSTQQITRETVTSSTLTTTSTSATQESSSRLVSSHSLPDTSLPRAQNPTITLLQKAREGQLPRGAHYLEQNNINEKSDSPPPAVRPNEILYSIRREYESENEDKRPKKLVDLGPRKYDGIGPVTKEGIPIVLRSDYYYKLAQEVQDENQQKWYKRMYDSLHRAEKDKEYLTVKYKARRDRYPYSSAGGYLSEPEPLGSYDSDYTSAKYATLDRRRIRNKDNDFTTSTMPRGKYNAVKHAVDVYKNQPGRIEDYEPGHSSIADKETKQWWDEVMDIFDGQFEQTQKSPPRTHAPTSSSTNKPFMTYALKESGYESDSTLVFKRRDETAQQLSPAEQRQAYKTIQRGGDVPLHGLRKPVPDKPKGPDDTELEYFPISPHLTRIRIHKTKQVIKPLTEVICYPVTSVILDNPPPVFGTYKRTARTSSSVPPTLEALRPPSPPKRRSSHNSSTLRLYSKMSISPAPKKSRLVRSASSGVEVDSNVQYLKDRISSKLGVGIDSSKDKKKVKITSGPTVGRSNRAVLRTESLSPSIHTSTTACSSGTKVTRKTSLERKSSSLRSRRDLVTPTRLGKSSELRAPAEVKKVLKQREVKERSSSSKSLPPGTVVKSSTTVYSSSRGTRRPKEDKQLKVTVAISAKGRELLKSSSVSSTPPAQDTSATSKCNETTTTSTATTTARPRSTSSSTLVPKSVSSRPSSRSDSDKRPSSRSTGRGSPIDREVKSPTIKIVTPPIIAVSPVPIVDLTKKSKKAEVSPDIPKKKKDKNGSSTSKSTSATKISSKKSTKEDSETNGKKRVKKSKDGDSPPSSKKLSKKNGLKKSRDKVEQKKNGGKTHDVAVSIPKETKDSLATTPAVRKFAPAPDLPNIDFKPVPGKAFFQNLLLRNLPSPTPSNVSTLQRTSSVLERAKKFHSSDGYSSLPYRSEPSLPHLNVYLNHKKPVSESKFRSLDREVTSNRSSRSPSPIYTRSKRYEFLEKIDKFDRMNNVWDRTNGYYSPADSCSRSPEVFKERSSSEPPRGSPPIESDHQTDTFGNVDNTHWDYDNMSPTHSRSPSCRRIRSARSAVKTIESIGGLRRKGNRAKSLSEADGKHSLPPFQAQSTSSLNLSHITDHSDYQAYVMELLHSTKKSDRFKELHKFYASLERMGELERTTSNTDLRPRKKGEEVIDYDRWKQLRTKERAEEELKHIYEKLKEDQKEKDLLFQPRDSETIKWRGDRGLRGKEKSVEDLRQRFQRMAHEDSDLEVCKRKEIDARKDVYKPLWRGSSVVNLANTLNCRSKRGRSVSEVDQTASTIPRPVGSRVTQSIGSRLWSSLSMEQVNALKSQLNEIYTTVSSLKRDRINKMLQGKQSARDYEIVIPSKENGKVDLPQPLHVRCNSLLTKEQLYSPLNRRKEAQRNEYMKADSIGSIPNWGGSKDSCSRSGDSSHSHSPVQPMSEKEKKQLSMTLSQEVKTRVSKKGSDRKKRHVSSSIVIPRETLGAVAAIKGTKKSGRMKSPSASDSSPRTCYSIEMSDEGSVCRQPSNSSQNQDKGDFLLVLTPKDDDNQEVKKVVDKWAESKSAQKTSSEDRVVARLVQTTSNSETDSGSSEASTVIHLGSREDVQKKVDYYETKAEERENKDFDGRVSRSAGDVRPLNQEIKQRAKSAPSSLIKDKSKSNLTSSQSFSDLKELFGEKKASTYATTHLRKVIESKNGALEIPEKGIQSIIDSGLHSSEESLPIRSRSMSPDPMKYYRAYLNMVKAGDVRKLRDKFESLDDLYSIVDEENFREPSPAPPKRYQSDPDLTKEFFARKAPEVSKTVIKGQEAGDVKWLKKKYEPEHRSRSKTRRVVSPVPLKSDNRFMPHINVISKLAALQQQRSLTAPARPDPCAFRTGEVNRLRQQFESQQRDLSLLGHMFTSTPDVRELRDIVPFLECNWVAHQYPKPRSLSSPETQRSLTYSPKPRPASASPVRRQTASILKPQQKKQRDIFGDQKFDPSIHRPLYRYQPPSPCVDTSYHYRPWTRDPNWWWRLYPSTSKPTVTFKEPLRGRVPVPQRESYPPQRRPESPHRYVESEVTIHYRSPVRSEEKQAWSEEELQRRQAEAMRRIYQEERRRKYLQELQDMYSRRHTDNFTPSQKSPIPLNRYDDFVDDLSPNKTRDRTPEPKLVARALYNFVGQSSRELTFRRGDIIYVRRQIDKNWYEGEHNAMIGLFPFNYVEIIPYDGIRTIPKRPTEGQARAKFNFQAQTHLELPLVKGELVLLTRRVDNNWFEGRIGTRKGIFPVSYVDVLVEPGERAISPVRVNTPTKPVASPAAHSLHVANNTSQHHYQPPRPVSYTSLPRQKTTDLKQPPVNQTLHIDTQNEPVPYRVLYNYAPQNDDELELVEGETVYVMEKCDDGWYVGSSQRTGYLGTFPGNYVQRQV